MPTESSESHEYVARGTAERLDRALGTRSNAEVAEAITTAGFECTGELVRRYRAGLVTRMDADFFVALARAYRLGLEWLLLGEGPQMRGSPDAAVEAMNQIADLVDRYREGVGSTARDADAEEFEPGEATAHLRQRGEISPARPKRRRREG